MKNMKKLVALFAAATMAMSMSISAFAEVVQPTISTDKATLTINVTSADEAQITMMAYVVEGTDWTVETAPAYSNQEIVALDQNAGANGFTTVPVDPAKLEDGNTIVVKIGGSAGNVATYLITMEEQIVTYSVTYELAGGTVTNAGANTFDADDTIAAFFAELEAPLKAATTTATYTFAGWSKTDGGEAIDTASTALMTTLLDEGATSITLYALYTETVVTPPSVDTVEVLIGDVDNTVGVAASDYIQIRGYVNLTEAQKALYRGKVGTTVGELIIGDVDNTVGVAASDYIQVRGYVNLTEEQKALYRGKVGTTVEVEVEK